MTVAESALSDYASFIMLIGSRPFERGMETANSIGSGAYASELDATEQASIAAAMKRIRNPCDDLRCL